VTAAEIEPAGQGLRHYFDVIRRRKWIVLATVVLAAAAAGAISALQDNVYRAETKIVIGQGGGLVQPGFANSIQPYTATMSDLLESDIVATNVIENLDLTDTPHELLDRISTSINPQTAVVAVFCDDHDQRRAVRICQELGLVFSQLVKNRFGQQSQTTAPGQTPTPPLSAQVFDPAHLLPGRVSPKPLRNVVIAAVLGLILGLIAAFLREHFDRGLRTREDVERSFGLPVIGQIPFERVHGKEERPVTWQGVGETSEAYRALRANLQYLAVQRPLRTILVTSASPKQGKTTVVANLAVTIARSGASTVVVDADLRRPRLERTFGVGGEIGLTNALIGSVDLADVLGDLALAEGERGGDAAGRLAFVPSGPLPPNPSELLSSARMTNVLDRLAAQFEYVLIDSPPVLLVADALELARNVDGVVLVVRRNHASTDDAREIRALVDRLGIHLVGAVLSDVQPVGTYGVYGDEPVAAERAGGPGEPAARPVSEREPASEEVF
jgi:receptor protein-tyrosine kinase